MRIALLLLLFISIHCASTETASRVADDILTVEGNVSVRGNEPFTVVMLETDQQNVYVLTLSDEDRTALQANLPGRYRITGHLYAADWNGKPFAHLRPLSMERL